LNYQNTLRSNMQNKNEIFISELPTQKIPPIASPKPQPVQVVHWIALAGITALSAFLNFFQLQQNKYGNAYYASAVKSMLLNWHNFFFVSFDPGGFVSVDKPPVDLWLQTLSAKIFGFSGFSLFLPQALAGVLAVVVLFFLVHRWFGPLSGLLAALIMAITPVGVVISRDNNIDMMLVLVVLLATWAIMRATEAGRIRWLLLGAVLLGIGFNIKTLEAYLVVPALGLFYLLSTPRKWWLRIGHLALALVVLLVISFSWIMAVDLTPASQRPYVGSSQTNSELELTLGYNGLARLFAPAKEPKTQPEHTSHASFTGALSLLQAFASDPQQTQANQATNTDSDDPGPLRLFIQPVGGQIAWLLPLALLSMLALAWQGRWRWSLDINQQALILWGTWLLTMLIAFSIAVHFLVYYTVMLAPAVSALSSIGLTTLWRNHRTHATGSWRWWLLPPTLLLTGLFQVSLLAIYPGWSVWLSPLIITLAVIAIITLVILRIFSSLQHPLSHIARIAVVLGTLAILIAPFVWSSVSLTYPSSGSGPTAGPQQPNLLAVFQDPSNTSSSFTLNKNQQTLLNYLLAKRGNTQFLMATSNSATAAPYILVTGLPVMALGGFSSNDPILTTTQLINEIQNETVRFFYLPFDIKVSKNTTKLIPTGGNLMLIHWVISNCTTVPPQDWEPGKIVKVKGKKVFRPTGNIQRTSDGGQKTNLLYDCLRYASSGII
jgi:4-amino-4-deoxy-L-arabinose transferase-like glycosyltransferase